PPLPPIHPPLPPSSPPLPPIHPPLPPSSPPLPLGHPPLPPSGPLLPADGHVRVTKGAPARREAGVDVATAAILSTEGPHLSTEGPHLSTEGPRLSTEASVRVAREAPLPVEETSASNGAASRGPARSRSAPNDPLLQ